MRIAFVAVGIVSMILILSSCGDKKKETRLLTTKEMQLVLWDMLQAEAYTQNFLKKDTSKNGLVENAALQKKIFELHKISREDYNASYSYYNAHPNEMKIILDSVTALAERNRNKTMQERYGKEKIVAE